MSAEAPVGDTCIAYRETVKRLCRRPALLARLPKVGWHLSNRGYDPGLFRRSLKKQKDKGFHSRAETREEAYEIREEALQTAQPHRDQFRAVKGLAARCHSIRPVPENLLLRYSPRRNRPALAMKLNGSGAW